MSIGICVPTAIPGLKPGRLVEWARHAEALGFDTLAAADRLSSGRYDCLTGLAASAAVTSRIKLMTTILISPLMPSAVYLAKQAASIDHMSSGRLSLGLAVGGRKEDYDLCGVDFHRRGRILDEQIATMKAVWAGEHGVGPEPVSSGGPAILAGGGSPQSLRRAVQNDGWIAGGGAGLEGFKQGSAEILEMWEKAGKPGKPTFVSVGHFALGPTAREDALALLTSSYGARAEAMLAGVPLTPDAVAEFVSSRLEAGCDEVIMTACSQELEQLDRYAEAVNLK